MAELSPEAFGFKPAGKSTKELDPSAFGFGSPTTEAVTPTAADYLKGIASGVGSLASGVGYLAEVAGANQVGRAIRGIGDTTQRYWQESMTPAGQRAAQSRVFEDDPGAAVPVKLGDRWGQALAMGAAQSAPSMLAAAIPGGIAAAGLRGAAGMAASRGIGGALAPLAAGSAAPIGGWATNFAGNLAARVPTALGFGAAEGAVAGATNAAQWKSDIEQKPLAELRNMPGFAALESQVGEQAARQQIAEQGASDIMRNTTLATGGIGALTGGGALGSAFQRVTTGAKGGVLGAIGRDAAKEAAQEIPQSGGERAIQNIATRDYLDPSQPITQGVLADALSGGAIGSVTGGVMGGGSHLSKGPLQKAAEASAATVPPAGTQNEWQGIPQSIPQGIPQSIPQEGGVPPAAGSTAGQTPAAVARADTSVLDVARAAAEDLETADTTSEGFRQTAEGLRKLPQQPNTPVAPGISPVPVSTAAPSLPSNQAESAGVPKPPQQGEKPSGPQAEIAQPAAPGQQAQPAAVFGAAGTVGNTGTQPAPVPANTGTQPAPVPANTGTQPVQAPANTGTQPAKAADSAEAEREWRDFVASEGRDIGPRQLAVIREQFMRRQMMNAAIEAATGRVEDARQREVAANRMAILDSLPLTTTGNTIRRFAASLRDAGIRDSRVSPEERQLIARRIAARDTLQHLEQVPPNELTLPEKQVKQAQPTMPRIESLRRRAAMPGVRIVGNRMLDRHGKRLATLSDDEAAELLPKPKPAPARTVEDTELADFIKSESADLGKRRLTLRALQAIRRQKQAEADKTDLEDLIEAERADLRERFAKLQDAQAAARARKPFVIPPLTTPAQPTTTRVMEQKASDLPLGKYGKAEPVGSADKLPAADQPAPAVVREFDSVSGQKQDAKRAAAKPAPASAQTEPTSNASELPAAEASTDNTQAAEPLKKPEELPAEQDSETPTDVAPSEQPSSAPQSKTDDDVAEQLASFEAGNYGAPRRISANLSSKSAIAIADKANADRRATYDKTAKQFLEGPLTAAPPKPSSSASDRIQTENLENVEPRPVGRNVVAAKTFAAKFKAMLDIAGNKDVRFYLNGVHIEDGGRMVATDGSRMAIVDGVDVSSAPKKPEEYPGYAYTVLGRDGQWIDGKFVDYMRAFPDISGQPSFTVDAQKLGDYARGITKASRYTDAGMGRDRVAKGDFRFAEQPDVVFSSTYISDAADLFRRLGYQQIEVTVFGPETGKPMALYSPDGKVKQAVMPRRASSWVPLFKAFGAGEVKAESSPSVPAKKTGETKDGEEGSVILYSGALSASASSPSDRAIFSMAAEGKPADEILSFISKSSRRPFNRVLADALRRAGIVSSVTLDTASRFGKQQGAARYAAAYNARTDTVALFTPRDAERHILHELVHAATMKAIAGKGAAAVRMRALFLHVQKSGSLDGQYGMSNVDEFVAEAFSNPRFQDALKGIPAPKGSTLTSAWQWFVRIVARIVGIKTQPLETALDRALTVGAQLMRENAAVMAASGDTRYAIAWHGTPHVWPPEPGFPHGRPRLDKMGTGEGAQAYGLGWYSAEAQDVAKSYQTTLTFDRGFDFDGKSGLTREQVQDLVNAREGKKYLDGVSLPSGVADRVIDDIVYGSNGKPLPRQYKPGSERAALYQKLINEIRHTDSGSLYQLDIPDDVMPTLLDWDKPLIRQSAAVREALLPIINRSHEWSKTARWPKDQTPQASDLENVSGEMLLKHLRANNPEGKPIEHVLRDAGIPGLRYLDGSSRSKGAGTYNYVIWDQKVLDRIALLERNGEKLDAIRAADEVRLSLDAGQPFDGPEVAATPLKPGVTTINVDGTERPALNGVDRYYPSQTLSDVVLARQSAMSKSRPYGNPGDSERISDLLIGRSFSLHGLGGLDVPAQREVLNSVVALGNDKEVVRSVVEFIPVDVMNVLRRENGSAESIFSDKTVLKKFLSADGNGSVATAIDIADALVAGIARVAAKRPIPGWLVPGRLGKGNSATGANVSDEAHFSTVPQIKATGNSGSFSPTDPDIRFNIATDWQQSPVAQEVAKAFQYAAKSDAALSWLNPVQTQYHKAERLAQQGKFGFKRVFDLGQKFLSDIARFAVMAENSAPTLFHQIRSLADAKQAADAALRGDFGQQRNADIRAIAAPLYEGTLYGGGNPMAGMVWSDAQLRSRFGLTDRQIVLYHEAREAVKVSMDEMAKSLIARHAKREKVAADTSGSLQDVAEGVRDTLTLRADVLADEAKAKHDDTMQQVEDLRNAGGQDRRAKDMQKEADAKLDSQKAEVARIRATVEDVQAIADKAQKLQDAGYFPLMRFGRHTVTARDAAGKVKHFSMHDGIPLVPRSGQAQANRLADALREEHPDWDVTTGLMNPEKYKLYQGMNVDALQLFADHLDDETRQTYQEIIRLATNERAALRRMLTREGTPGFDRDVRRTLASFILSNARYTSSSYHLADMAKAAEQAEEDGGDVGAEAVKLYEYVTKPQEEAAKLRGFLFFNFLGGSLAAAMVNATQVPMMTFPRLAQYEDAGKLAARLARAAKVAVQNPEDVQGDVGAALRRAEEDGITAPHQIYEMTATAANNVFSGSRAGSAILRAWGKPFALAESFNRRTTFVAAFQIGRGMTVNQLRDAGVSTAFEFAEKVVQETQGIYNRGNRVNIGRGAIRATVMTFRQFSIMYLEMFSRLPPKQKAIMAGMLILAAGAGGLPFAEDIEDIIDTIGQWLGYRTNTRRTIRRGLSSFAGQRAADIAMNGVLSQMGVDLHSRLGLHNILPGTALLKPSTTDKGREFQDLLGPAASVVAAMGQALQDLATGRPDKAALAMAPVAVQNAVKGIKMAATGRAEDARGKPTIPVSLSEAGAKAIGFNPKSVADYGAVKRASTQDDRLLDVMRERFTSAIVDAIVANDQEAKDEAFRQVLEWNRQNPDARIDINPAAIRKRVRDMRSDGPSRVLKSLSPSLRQQARQEFANAQ